ncbi:MAG: dihydropyrimidine dehydrogenase subunit A [Bryobacteraceae bacterium]|nr:MAG: dihydropyrimidine dehydrogenase subunit A [Bryobacteraceae bacterium]
MGKPTGFMEYQRESFGRRPVEERVRDWFEVYVPLPEDRVRKQGARCMDCGVPFCHTGCPLTNLIPDWNDLVYKGRWREAIRELHATNNFPEFTSRICPAPCESACVLGINEPPVSIKAIERAIIDRAWAEGWIQPEPPLERTGKRVAVVGSGPAGLAAAQQLARKGHLVTVFEKADRIGGLLRYGIPDFKMEKHHIDRRMAQMEAEGVTFRTRCHVGVDVTVEELRKQFHAIVLAGGAEQPRDLRVPGRELKGIHFAMEFLPLNNKRNAGDEIPAGEWISAAGKNVIIIGGGDTGADCLGTSIRHGAKSIRQFEIMPMPPSERSPQTPWPLWPYQLRSETSHEEGGERIWSISTLEFLGDENGHVRALRTTRVGPPPKFEPLPGTEEVYEAELVLLAMGFTGPVKNGLLEQLGVEFDARGNVKADENFMTSVPGVFAAGDVRRGQSLVVWAIAEGRKAAEGVHEWLMSQPVPEV